MKKLFKKGVLVSIILLLFLTSINAYADNTKENNEIDFKKIKREIELMKKNLNQNMSNNCNNYWDNDCDSETVNTLGNRFTRDNKAIISGMFNDIDNDEVCDYGFLIGNDKDKITKKISLKKQDRENGFMEYKIDDFELGKTYYYQAFIEYENKIVKGKVSWFHKGTKGEVNIQEFIKKFNQNKLNLHNSNCNKQWNNNFSKNWNSKFNTFQEKSVSTFGFRYTHSDTVIISGMFNDIENDAVCDYGFLIGNDKNNLTKKISLKKESKHNGYMDYELEEFENGKIYYYQAFIEYEDEIIKGSLFMFSIGKQEIIKVITVNALKGYEENTVLFIGKCENKKSIINSKYGFYWGYSKEKLVKKSYYDNTNEEYFIQSVKNIDKGVIYYQAFVEYNGKIVKGEIKSF
ncbi:hypothetical protein [Oceanirhabdus sp. W0125-5]|uniref:hypothetical protein n=1 Tax=Oceanirhabdus sp. W0125-5 TaxID=2999116 RepID=UPI0022F3054A|nr:hypothetical protein [Oceanirhabdus sp. W0125-5]WBW95528.1 hypothetical protein OW730_17765 [Oceanirhabdus sp. W0125-5]